MSPTETAVSCEPPPQRRSYAWPWVLCLLGVDYFSTLAYQPSMTYQLAGRLGPLATLVVVLVTLGGAVPVYWYVAGRSTHGEGSIAMLERLVHGWRGKSLVLLMLGFAATDFVMVKTISVADAAVHVIGNPHGPWQDSIAALADWSKQTGQDFGGPMLAGLFDKQLIVTIVLGFLGFVFWFMLRNGFNTNVVVLAVPLVGIYLLLNAVIIVGGLVYLGGHSELIGQWQEALLRGDWGVRQEGLLPAGANVATDWLLISLLCLFFFPSLSLGLSGFEMSLILMPQIKGIRGDDPDRPAGRVRNARKILVSAALIMSLFLMGSVVVTNLLIPADELHIGGAASNRALAYLAHGGQLYGDDSLGPFFGGWFGTLYDVTTILVLTLAGTSIMTALSVLLPQFLFRFGMTVRWADRWGLLLVLFGLVNLAVTVYFRADVNQQRGAYATGVLVLFTSASVATVLDKRRRLLRDQPGRRRLAVWLSGYSVIALIFAVSALAVMVHTPSGLLIAAGFILVLFASSIVTRALRTNELRTIGFEFKDEHSRFLWNSLRLADFPVLVPHRPGRHERQLKDSQIREHHQLSPDADVVFLEIEVRDPSNFSQKLWIEVFEEYNRFVIKAGRCVSVAHAIAAIAVEMSRYSKPPGLHFGWPDMDLMTASWGYFAFGEGNVPWKVRELIERAEPDPEKRPRVIIG